jgi:hypothetical protein
MVFAIVTSIISTTTDLHAIRVAAISTAFKDVLYAVFIAVATAENFNSPRPYQDRRAGTCWLAWTPYRQRELCAAA